MFDLLRSTKALRIEGKVLIIAARSANDRSWIEHRLLDTINNRALVYGDGVNRVQFVNADAILEALP